MEKQLSTPLLSSAEECHQKVVQHVQPREGLFVSLRLLAHTFLTSAASLQLDKEYHCNNLPFGGMMLYPEEPSKGEVAANCICLSMVVRIICEKGPTPASHSASPGVINKEASTPPALADPTEQTKSQMPQHIESITVARTDTQEDIPPTAEATRPQSSTPPADEATASSQAAGPPARAGIDVPPPTTDATTESYPLVPQPIPAPIAAHAPAPPKSLSLQELFQKGSMALVDFYWLASDHYDDDNAPSFCSQAKQLVRRQELPAEALCAPEEAMDAVDEYWQYEGAVSISYGWLAPHNPDPTFVYKQQIDCIVDELGNGLRISIKRVFWDFMSLHQLPRSASETAAFREALASMHLVYSNPKWAVIRFLDIPHDALNNTPYEKRGWCFFESSVALGAGKVISIKNGSCIHGSTTPVPLDPDRFAARVKHKKFASPRADIGIVCSLYRRLFQDLAKIEDLAFTNWEDDDVRDFMLSLSALAGLKNITIDNHHHYDDDGHPRQLKISIEMKMALIKAMGQRGGDCTIVISEDSIYDQMICYLRPIWTFRWKHSAGVQELKVQEWGDEEACHFLRHIDGIGSLGGLFIINTWVLAASEEPRGIGSSCVSNVSDDTKAQLMAALMKPGELAMTCPMCYDGRDQEPYQLCKNCMESEARCDSGHTLVESHGVVEPCEKCGEPCNGFVFSVIQHDTTWKDVVIEWRNKFIEKLQVSAHEAKGALDFLQGYAALAGVKRLRIVSNWDDDDAREFLQGFAAPIGLEYLTIDNDVDTFQRVPKVDSKWECKDISWEMVESLRNTMDQFGLKFDVIL